MPADIVHSFNSWLRLPAALYGFAVGVRNLLYDWHFFKSRSYDIPVISVGNLAVGGTGKTPHIEYLVRLLSPHYRVAVLSRGYRRSSKGYVQASSKSTARTLGDEPYQMWRKFPNMIVAVDVNRCHGIEQLMSLSENRRPEVILLDDAFQHRHVIPSLSLLLTDSHRPYYHDRLLPMGRLREPITGAVRADVVVVTRCDEDLQPIDYRVLEKGLNLRPHQLCFFSHLEYGELQPLFPEASQIKLKDIDREKDGLLLIAGIAAPDYFFNQGRAYCKHVTTYTFPDHHAYNHNDVLKMISAFNALQTRKKIVIVTEKDGVRLLHSSHISPAMRRAIYYWPIRIVFHNEEEDAFNKLILDHVADFKKKGIDNND